MAPLNKVQVLGNAVHAYNGIVAFQSELPLPEHRFYTSQALRGDGENTSRAMLHMSN